MEKVELTHFYGWDAIKDHQLVNVMCEFRDNGETNVVFGDGQCRRTLEDPMHFLTIRQAAKQAGVRIFEMHSPFGPTFDLSCAQPARIPGLIEDHIKMMTYASELGCKTYVLHVGAYEMNNFNMPIEKLRTYVIDKLEHLLPAAEKLGIIIAVENVFHPSDTPDEVVNYIEHFNSPFIGCCYDAGHANIMTPYTWKKRELYSPYIRDNSWKGALVEYQGALERLAPYIVTCHLHDNNGYSDEHKIPGEGCIDWKSIMSKLAKCPRLVSLQDEVTSPGRPYSIKQVCEAFRTKVMPFFK